MFSNLFSGLTFHHVCCLLSAPPLGGQRLILLGWESPFHRTPNLPVCLFPDLDTCFGPEKLRVPAPGRNWWDHLPHHRLPTNSHFWTSASLPPYTCLPTLPPMTGQDSKVQGANKCIISHAARTHGAWGMFDAV